MANADVQVMERLSSLLELHHRISKVSPVDARRASSEYEDDVHHPGAPDSPDCAKDSCADDNVQAMAEHIATPREMARAGRAEVKATPRQKGIPLETDGADRTPLLTCRSLQSSGAGREHRAQQKTAGALVSPRLERDAQAISARCEGPLKSQRGKLVSSPPRFDLLQTTMNHGDNRVLKSMVKRAGCSTRFGGTETKQSGVNKDVRTGQGRERHVQHCIVEVRSRVGRGSATSDRLGRNSIPEQGEGGRFQPPFFPIQAQPFPLTRTRSRSHSPPRSTECDSSPYRGALPRASARPRTVTANLLGGLAPSEDEPDWDLRTFRRYHPS